MSFHWTISADLQSGGRCIQVSTPQLNATADEVHSIWAGDESDAFQTLRDVWGLGGQTFQEHDGDLFNNCLAEDVTETECSGSVLIVHNLVAADIPDDAMCYVCLEDVCGNDVARLMKLTCGHVFHIACVDTWLRKKNTCPTCRSKNTV
jgi:hypothetical protein